MFFTDIYGSSLKECLKLTIIINFFSLSAPQRKDNKRKVTTNEKFSLFCLFRFSFQILTRLNLTSSSPSGFTPFVDKPTHMAKCGKKEMSKFQH